MEVSEYLVGSPAFKAGDTGDPRMAGSIPVHLRHSSRGRNPSLALLDARRPTGGPDRPNRLRSFGRPSRPVAVMLMVAALVLGLSGSAGAQARVLASSPEDGESLSTLETVWFEFDSLLLEAGAEITVTKFDGTEVRVESATVDGARLSAEITDLVPSGNYSVAYAVESADGITNDGAIRVSVDSPAQALSGGLLAVIALGVAMFGYLAFVFRADQRRRRRR